VDMKEIFNKTTRSNITKKISEVRLGHLSRCRQSKEQIDVPRLEVIVNFVRLLKLIEAEMKFVFLLKNNTVTYTELPSIN
jgi:hypothetical protein